MITLRSRNEQLSTQILAATIPYNLVCTAVEFSLQTRPAYWIKLEADKKQEAWVYLPPTVGDQETDNTAWMDNTPIPDNVAIFLVTNAGLEITLMHPAKKVAMIFANVATIRAFEKGRVLGPRKDLITEDGVLEVLGFAWYEMRMVVGELLGKLAGERATEENKLARERAAEENRRKKEGHEKWAEGRRRELGIEYPKEWEKKEGEVDDAELEMAAPQIFLTDKRLNGTIDEIMKKVHSGFGSLGMGMDKKKTPRSRRSRRPRAQITRSTTVVEELELNGSARKVFSNRGAGWA